MVGHLNNNRGQTSVEYLMLLAVTFIASYIMIRGPIGSFTTALFQNLYSGLQNLVTNAEFSGDTPAFDQAGHPSNTRRLKPLHL
jgi:hypothetical protein